MTALNRYRVLRVLGNGGAGQVSLVEDRIFGGVPIALKRIVARADDLLRTSFEREFSVLASLSLPGVARVIDFGIDDSRDEAGPLPFFTRTYIEGDTLDVALARASENEILETMLAVAEVVAPLHRRGVIHGDLKPTNVIVDTGGAVHVIDFGLSHLLVDVDRSGVVGGTPAFMAPEQLRGAKPAIVGDVYSLGATLFSLLTGAPPRSSAGRAKSTGTPAERNDDTALGVAARAMEVDPYARTPSVEDFIAALERFANRRRPSSSIFVPPRPVAHEDVLASLERGVGGKGDEPRHARAFLVEGMPGSGRTTLLRELKWRLQLRGVHVLEWASDVTGQLQAMEALASQASAFFSMRSTPSGVARVVRRDEGETREDQALDAILRLSEMGPVVVLADDLDRAEPSVGRFLRSLIHGMDSAAVSVVAAASERSAAAVRELSPASTYAVPSLDANAISSLVSECVGPVDATVVEAILEKTGGSAAAVVELLSALSAGAVGTAADIAAFPTSEPRLAIASARLSHLHPDEKQLLEILAFVQEPTSEGQLVGAVAVVHGMGEPSALRAIAKLHSEGLVRSTQDAVSLSDGSIGDALISSLDAVSRRRLATSLLAAVVEPPWPDGVVARLAVMTEHGDRIRQHAVPCFRSLLDEGAYAAAVKLGEALLGALPDTETEDVGLGLATAQLALGDCERAIDRAAAVIAHSASEHSKTEAALLASRAMTSAGRYDQALGLLGTLASQTSERRRAMAQREIAKIYLRRGEYDQAREAAEVGLGLCPSGDEVCIELLTSIGLIESYQGNHERAQERYGQALNIATSIGSKRDEANVLAYLAIDHQRASRFEQARELYERSLSIARDLQDTGGMATFSLNLGTVRQALGDVSGAIEDYERAARLARRAGRFTTDLAARNNLATLHVYVGSYEAARSGAEAALRDARSLGLRIAAAQALGVLAEVHARRGEYDEAIRLLGETLKQFEELGQEREMAEALLDLAEALLDRQDLGDGASPDGAKVTNTSVDAGEVLSRAREIIERCGLVEFAARLSVLTAHDGLQREAPEALRVAEAALEECRVRGDKSRQWQVMSVLARIHSASGNEFLARKFDVAAMEILEEIVATLPVSLRECFFHDPRRARARRLAHDSSRGPAASRDQSSGQSLDARVLELLDVFKRLTSEHDLDRLLERITDSAASLFRADQGVLLLVDESGQLLPHNAYSAGVAPTPVGQAFSRSIAEAVLIDGEPLVSADAKADSRLREYRSVHQRTLTSVACFPIRGRTRVHGVLYLEHRGLSAALRESDIRLLTAFTDQAAIAVDNAHLLAENRRRAEELNQASASLREARDDVERLLHAKTAELEATKVRLASARGPAAGHAAHGMVGRSEPIRRALALIQRVAHTDVPVVIEGESGTGKELAARAIHDESQRREQPFIAVNCGALPEHLLEAELFGHERGAFTGADHVRHGLLVQASGGTLFLDELEAMSGKMQVGLLRVLQEAEVVPLGANSPTRVDVRFVAATHTPLADLVNHGAFREDLFYRLSVVTLTLAPLRERPTDIPELAEHFLSKFSHQLGTPKKRLSREAMVHLCSQPWPGNVRQLEHCLLNACILGEGSTIELSDVLAGTNPAGYSTRLERSLATREPGAGSLDSAVPGSESQDRKSREKTKILHALETTNWNRAKAATLLGMPRRTFYRRLREYNIL